MASFSHRTGNKSTLITRLQEFEREQLKHAGPPPTIQQQVRLASTTEVPGMPSSAEPSPIPPNYPKEFLDVKIPNVSQPPIERPVEIVRIIRFTYCPSSDSITLAFRSRLLGVIESEG
jgi:hypothetical protein